MTATAHPIHNPDLFLKWRDGEWPYPKSKARRAAEAAAADDAQRLNAAAVLPPRPAQLAIDAGEF